mgnify:CR=1 FL=1
MNEKINTSILTILVALCCWSIYCSSNAARDMGLVKEKITQIEKDLNEQLWNNVDKEEK